ncbi:MAG: ribosome biogenesis GTPase Der [Parvibaculales bacterium]
MLRLAIIGRANVGKSTLFNRLTGKRHAIVDDRPGVTRDRREGEGQLGGLSFQLIDTAGFEEGERGSLEERMGAQTKQAIEGAHLVLMLVDARAGILAQDRSFAQLLQKTSTPVILAANKCEGGRQEAGVLEAYELGLGTPLQLSAEHGLGLGELYDAISEHIGKSNELTEEIEQEAEHGDSADKPIRVAILGRPNVGKSTLVNYLLGEERVLTGPEAGITRDAIGISWIWRKKHIKLFDTAGVRRKARISEKLEKLSIADSLRAVQFAEIVVMVIDAKLGLDKQDIQLANLVAGEGRAIILGVNKWDSKGIDKAALLTKIEEQLEAALSEIRGVPIVSFSARTGYGVKKIMPAVMRQYKLWNSRVSTAKLNRFLEEVTTRHAPPADKGRAVKLRYMTQPKTRPPGFVIFSARAPKIPVSYQRYLINHLREAFGLHGVPVRIFIRKQDNPYVKK